MHVINYIAQGTIEHGMLDLLKFKKSLFAGVLDGGQDEVFLGGTRLKRFMESVESATNGIPQPADPTPDVVPDVEPADSVNASVDAVESAIDRIGSSPAGQAADGWSQLIAAGKNALDALAKTLDNSGSSTGDASTDTLRIERDSASGKTYLKFPVPPPDVLGRAVLWLQTLAGALQK